MTAEKRKRAQEWIGVVLLAIAGNVMLLLALGAWEVEVDGVTCGSDCAKLYRVVFK